MSMELDALRVERAMADLTHDARPKAVCRRGRGPKACLLCGSASTLAVCTGCRERETPSPEAPAMTPATLSHDECQQTLAEGWTDHPAVRAHLATCIACVEFADALAEVDRLLASIVAPPPPPGFVDRILRAICEERIR